MKNYVKLMRFILKPLTACMRYVNLKMAHLLSGRSAFGGPGKNRKSTMRWPSAMFSPDMFAEFVVPAIKRSMP